MSGLVLTEITKAYGSVRVIDNLSLAIEPGELVVFLGPSGCGKSTLLRMIAGLETVDGGAIHMGGRRLDTLPPAERRLAMVFQHYALYPHMTVRENMAFGLRNAGIGADEIERRIAVAVQSLEMEALLERKPGQLSGGQRQRVAIGRAIVKEPDLFLLDEPLSNLDAALRLRTRLELAQLHRRLGAMMIFVTHDQVEAMTLADRIVVLNGGAIEQVGAPMEIYQRPRTRFVAEFVGSPRINMLPAIIRPGEGGMARAEVIGGQTVETRVPFAEALGEGVMLGIRPEHVRVADPETASLVGQAEVVERLGERTLVHVALGEGVQVVAEDLGTSQVRMGDRVGLRLQSEAAHLFDADGIGHHVAGVAG